ncbi:hypothetical protein C369_07314 [Cryptococcus neoformans A5-35-17]|nr:hypothetical protein C369_07314 [Cryptococcus neoformans var. grubii A5-35-17]
MTSGKEKAGRWQKGWWRGGKPITRSVRVARRVALESEDRACWKSRVRLVEMPAERQVKRIARFYLSLEHHSLHSSPPARMLREVREGHTEDSVRVLS